MTVKSDLEMAVASAESAKGTYLMAAQSTEDATAKQKYEEMAMNIESHVSYLNSRLDYLNSSNTLNTTQG
jgi:rubrerythrin